jgi:aspartate/methionine/tyrosine aminotransferase
MQAWEEENEAIRQESEALYEALSPLGQRVSFPPDIPFQAAQARDKRFNATIGQITDGAGSILALPTVEEQLDLESTARNKALLYSPVQGHQEVREKWRQRQRREAGDAASSLPLVTVGLTHGLSLAADLFGGVGRTVAIPAPFWGNYRQTFAMRTGATVATAPAYREGVYNPTAIAEALTDLPPGEPAVAILNLPSNPGGYSLTSEQRRQVRESLLKIAAARPLVVLCDDAYAGLVYEEAIPSTSMFWELAGSHPNLVPVKIDGATKEFNIFGGRVGFLTFAFDPESPAALALESKVKCLTRATVGSPVSVSQMLLLAALENNSIEEEIERVRQELGRRYRTLRSLVDGLDRGLLRPLPFNSGCFALLELAPGVGVEAEAIRRHLLDERDTGLIAIKPNYLRIAFCSVAEESLPEVVSRLEAGVAALAAAR